MTKTQNLIMAAALATAFAVSATAQGYSQPVREVEKEARLSVYGSCYIDWTAFAGTRQCQLTVVPAGKILAIRHVSVGCIGKPGDGFSRAAVAITNAGPRTVTIPLINDGPDTGLISRVGSIPVFFNAQPGQVVEFFAAFFGMPSVSSPPNCTVWYDGFLIDK